MRHMIPISRQDEMETGFDSYIMWTDNWFDRLIYILDVRH